MINVGGERFPLHNSHFPSTHTVHEMLWVYVSFNAAKTASRSRLFSSARLVHNGGNKCLRHRVVAWNVVAKSWTGIYLLASAWSTIHDKLLVDDMTICLSFRFFSELLVKFCFTNYNSQTIRTKSLWTHTPHCSQRRRWSGPDFLFRKDSPPPWTVAVVRRRIYGGNFHNATFWDIVWCCRLQDSCH